MNFFAIGLIVTSLLGFIIQTILLTKADETIMQYEALIEVQDQIITEYRKRFGDIKIDLSGKV